jgi:hypothetical protein
MKKIFLGMIAAGAFALANDLYIVTSDNGVNVRNDAMYGTNSNKIIDSLQEGTGLKLIEEVKMDESNTWGRFLYNKNGNKLGWIHMNYVESVTKRR